MVARDANGRFVKGHSGNPKGRNRLDEEQRYLRTLRKALPQSDIKAIVEALAKKAMRGDVRAAQLLLEYGIGKPTQYVKTEQKLDIGGGVHIYMPDNERDRD